METQKKFGRSSNKNEFYVCLRVSMCVYMCVYVRVCVCVPTSLCVCVLLRGMSFCV